MKIKTWRLVAATVAVTATGAVYGTVISRFGPSAGIVYLTGFLATMLNVGVIVWVSDAGK